jgi:hypothetical protein
MSRAINFDTIRDNELKTANTTAVVLNAYTTMMVVPRNERKAFQAAVRAWQERNPNASREQAPPAVASILCHKL